jgi:uncharacterized protein
MRKFMKGLLAATLLGPAPVLAQTPDPTPAPLPAAAPATIQADPALWVVKDKDTTIYLFGTVHVLKPNVHWFDDGVKAAYDASSEVVFEIVQPDPQVAQGTVMQKAVDPDGPPLSKKLTGDAAGAYEKALATVGISTAALDHFEPWFVATALSLMSVQKAGFAADSGVEQQLGAAAKRDGKKVGELETFEQQLNYFDSMPEPQQIAFLNSTISELPNAATMLDSMVASWAKGDPEALAKQINESVSITPELAKMLLTDRNARWADWIANRMKQPGTIFIAVGAGHLAGKDSVQDFLKARKIEAKRIPS